MNTCLISLSHEICVSITSYKCSGTLQGYLNQREISIYIPLSIWCHGQRTRDLFAKKRSQNRVLSQVFDFNSVKLSDFGPVFFVFGAELSFDVTMIVGVGVGVGGGWGVVVVGDFFFVEFSFSSLRECVFGDFCGSGLLMIGK